MAAQFGKVARQLENPVDRSHIDFSSFVVYGQMREPPLGRGKSLEGWGLATREGWACDKQKPQDKKQVPQARGSHWPSKGTHVQAV